MGLFLLVEIRAHFVHHVCRACLCAAVSGVVTASATALLGWSRGMPMSQAYGRYLTKAGPLSGPGDLLLELLNPMTMCLGFRMFGKPADAPCASLPSHLFFILRIPSTAVRAPLHALWWHSFYARFLRVGARRTICENAKGCIIGSAWCATTSLLGSAAVCRLCGLSTDLALVLANKGISSPFALAGAAALGRRKLSDILGSKRKKKN